MSQDKFSKVSDVEFELLYNSLFANPKGISVNKVTNQKYVNFIVNPLISGNSLKIQSVELNKTSMSNLLQDKRAKVLEGILLNSKNFGMLFKNANIARLDISDNIDLAMNYASKFVVMTQYMYANLKPQVQKELMKNFAINLAILSKENLISEDAIKFATEYMSGVDSKFKKFVFKFPGEENIYGL